MYPSKDLPKIIKVIDSEARMIRQVFCKGIGEERTYDDGWVYVFPPFSNEIIKVKQLSKDEVDEIIDEAEMDFEKLKNTSSNDIIK